jgi:hypothetical protein
VNSLVELAHRTEIAARFRRTLLIFWLPLVLAALVPAIVTAVAAWFGSSTSPHDAILILILILTVGLAIVARLTLNHLKGGHPPPTSSAGVDHAPTGTTTPAVATSDNNWGWARRIEADEKIQEAAAFRALRMEETEATRAPKKDD